MIIRYQITATKKREEKPFFSNILEVEHDSPNHIPSVELEAIGKQLAPCNLKCECIGHGWYAEKSFS